MADEFVNTTVPEQLTDERRRRKLRPADMSLNLVAAINVFFIVLSMFMVGTKFLPMEGALNSKLPEVGTGNGGPQVVVAPIKLSVRQIPGSGDIEYNIDGNVFRLDKANFYKQMEEYHRRAGKGSATKVYMNPNAMVPWDVVLNMYNTLQKIGYTDINWSDK